MVESVQAAYNSPRRAAATKRPGTLSFLPSGVVTSTSSGAVAFHCARRDLVRLRDFFRFGTATYLPRFP